MNRLRPEISLWVAAAQNRGHHCASNVFIADQNGTFQSDFLVQSYGLLNASITQVYFDHTRYL